MQNVIYSIMLIYIVRNLIMKTSTASKMKSNGANESERITLIHLSLS